MAWRALLVVAVIAALPADLNAQCRLCAGNAPAPRREAPRPLTIEVETSLDFSRAAATRSGGSIDIDERSGARRVAGLTDLGGLAIKGVVRLTGEPLRHVHISLPTSARLLAPNGSVADASDLRTDLPPDPTLDALGRLTFTFGGKLVVGPYASGEFRGRIGIVAEYE